MEAQPLPYCRLLDRDKFRLPVCSGSPSPVLGKRVRVKPWTLEHVFISLPAAIAIT